MQMYILYENKWHTVHVDIFTGSYNCDLLIILVKEIIFVEGSYFWELVKHGIKNNGIAE